VKAHTAVAFLLCATALLGRADARGLANLLPNPGFEEGLAGWELAGDPAVVLDVAARHGGRQSLRVAPRQGPASTDLLKVSATVPARPGETYRARFWVLAGPVTDGSEPYGALEFLAGDQRLGLAHTDFGVNRYEPGAWHCLQVLGVVPAGTTAVRLSLLMHPHAAVWFDDAELVRLRPAPAPETTAVTLRLQPGQTLCRDWRGFGVQGEVFLHLQRSVQQGYTAADRRLIEDRIRALRPHLVRLTVRLSDWESQLGLRTPDNDTLKDLKATIALYGEVGGEVQLTEWGQALPDWCRPTERLPHPDRRRAFTDSWAALLRHLRHDCGLTNVRYVTLHNEPNNLPWNEYRLLCRSLDASLDAAGIRREIQLIGPDEANENLLLPLAIRDVDNVLDGYDAHGYTANTGEEFGLWVEGRTCLMPRTRRFGFGDRRKPFLISEFGMAAGMDTWQTPHNDEYGYGLFLADAAIEACRRGASGLVMYCIGDYDCGTKMKWGLWKGRDEGWEPRPGYYAWSLVTSTTRLGSSVHPLESDAVSVPAVALRAPDRGPWTLMAVNRLPVSRPLVLAGLPRDSTWTPFVYRPEAIPTSDRGLIPAGPTETADAKGVLTTTLPPNAFAVWRDVAGVTLHRLTPVASGSPLAGSQHRRLWRP